MAKYRTSLVSAICELIIKHNLSVTEACRLAGITRNTFYNWYKKKPLFREALDKAQRDRDNRILRALSHDKIVVYEETKFL